MGLIATVGSKLRSDFGRLSTDVPTAGAIARRSVVDPGFCSVMLYRVQQALHPQLPRLAMVVNVVNHTLNGIDFMPGCEIGAGLKISHPTGIVIGSRVVAGQGLTLTHGATIGERYIDSRADGLYPTLGDHVTIGTCGVVIGNTVIGDHVTVPALSLVDSDRPSRPVPQSSTTPDG